MGDNWGLDDSTHLCHCDVIARTLPTVVTEVFPALQGVLLLSRSCHIMCFEVGPVTGKTIVV